jgi:hypothetical protein
MPEEEVQQPKNNLPKAVVILAVLVVFGAGALGYSYFSKDKETIPASTSIAITSPFTDTEKRALLESFNQSTSSAPTLTDKQKANLLNSMAKSSTSTTLTNEQKMKLLQSM